MLSLLLFIVKSGTGLARKVSPKTEPQSYPPKPDPKTSRPQTSLNTRFFVA